MEMRRCSNTTFLRMGMWVLLLSLLLPAVGARAQDKIGSVTMLMGAPRMVGESITPLQPVLSGNMLETGTADGIGLLIEDIVLHIGVNSKVSVREEQGRVVVELEAGFVVIYTDRGSQREVTVETPFGRLNPKTLASGADSGWYVVRHDPADLNVSPAVSTFSTIEGESVAEGTDPVAGPHQLLTNQRWRMVGGVVPGPPEEGSDQARAEQLQSMLHLRTSELVHAGISDKTLARLQRTGPNLHLVATPDYTGIYDNNDVPLIDLFPPDPEQRYVFGLAGEFPEVQTAQAQFVGYANSPLNQQDWNNYLTAVDGNPAFQPFYIDRFDNGGFTYIQFAGSDAQVVTQGGEVFLVGEQVNQGGWALFTPDQALADEGFANNSDLMNVVTAGFRAVAEGQDPSNQGRISDFVEFSPDGSVALKPDSEMPVGYPFLEQALDLSDFPAPEDFRSDQLAALGAGIELPPPDDAPPPAGQEPPQLADAANQLVFLSNSGFDSLDNRTNFIGDPISPTELDLPGDRTVVVDSTSTGPSSGFSLSGDSTQTVGIQFAPRGDILAIIHHTGPQGLSDTSPPTSRNGNFEIIRGQRYSIVRWQDGRRTEGRELENFGDDGTFVDMRNELFLLICTEINEIHKLTPDTNHTLCGPATVAPESPLRAVTARRSGQVVQLRKMIMRGDSQLRRAIIGRTPTARGSRGLLVPGGGRLLRSSGSVSPRRYLGKIGVAK